MLTLKINAGKGFSVREEVLGSCDAEYRIRDIDPGASSSLARIPSDLHLNARHPRQQKKMCIRARRVSTMKTLLYDLFTCVINH